MNHEHTAKIVESCDELMVLSKFCVLSLPELKN